MLLPAAASLYNHDEGRQQQLPSQRSRSADHSRRPPEWRANRQQTIALLGVVFSPQQISAEKPCRLGPAACLASCKQRSCSVVNFGTTTAEQMTQRASKSFTLEGAPIPYGLPRNSLNLFPVHTQRQPASFQFIADGPATRGVLRNMCSRLSEQQRA